MAKSPFNALSKINNTSGRLNKRLGLSRISLKYGHSQLPVSVCKRTYELHSQDRMNQTHSKGQQKELTNLRKEEIKKKKYDLKCKYFAKDSETEYLSKYIKTDLQNAHSDLGSNSIKNDFKRAKIGIFERKDTQFKHNKGVVNKSTKSKNKNKERKLLMNSTQMSPEKQTCQSKEIHHLENQICSIENSGNIKSSNNPNTTLVFNLANNSDIRCQQNPFNKNENYIKMNNKSKSNNLHHLAVHSQEGCDEKKLKEIECMTVNTCNTLKEVSHLKIQEELPNRKYRKIILPKLQKHLQIYNGNLLYFCEKQILILKRLKRKNKLN
jgi:hypothetical protein